MHVKLVVVDGDVKTSEVRLKIPAIIGRGRGASLQIPQALVSRQHCELSFADGKLRVRDLGSLNGTVVEGKKITDVEIASGQTLSIGSVTFRVEYGDAAGSSGDWKAVAKAAVQTVGGGAAGTASPGTTFAPAAAGEDMFVAVGGEPSPLAPFSDPSASSSRTRKGTEESSPEPSRDDRPSSDVMTGFERGSDLLPPLADPVGGSTIPPSPAAMHFVPPLPPVPTRPATPAAPAASAVPVAPAAAAPLAIPAAAPVPPVVAPSPMGTPTGPKLPASPGSSDDDDDDLRAFLQSLGK